MFILCQWFLNLLEVPNPVSSMQALTEPFLKIQIFINDLEPKVNCASVPHKIISFKETRPTKHELHTKTQLNKYLQKTNVSYTVEFWKQF